MAKFAVYTVVHEGFTAHNFKPGDDVPEWAIDLVGDHVLEPEAHDSSASETDFTGAPEAPADDEGKSDGDSADADADASGDDSDAADEAQDAPDEAPDFTAPAPARRGRPRKQ
ncbi:hypothetical protein [Arthrobacter sp. EpRS71]|uniref:hypothetical protein n=1 Tax=Arthrobacter sp. EpRS71 TaxID=1743141 RepID=UPI000749BC67|nr:hypothetical protein [Arthrobacter sp. EpRS71]KUM34541.1 hypothetical protein AR689_10380 [Arthrobacter sp. EpRS71]